MRTTLVIASACNVWFLYVVKFLAERGLAFGDDENLRFSRKFFQKNFQNFFKAKFQKKKMGCFYSNWFCNSSTNR